MANLSYRGRAAFIVLSARPARTAMIDRHVIGGMVIALPLRMNTTALLFVTFASNRSAQPVRETVPCGKWGSVKLYLARRMRALGCDKEMELKFGND